MGQEERSTPHGETPYSPTSLLRALTADPLDVDALRGTDEAHEEAAPPDTPLTRTVTVLVAILLGFAVAVSVGQLRSDAVAADGPRSLLEEQVRTTRGEVDALQAQQDDLEARIADLQGDVLEAGDPGGSERLAAYERAGSAVALTGPGVVLELDDSARLPAGPGVAEGTVNRVTDGDLQIAVNGLWAAGAEAIAVNGQRLGSTSAIRTAGSAILVDFGPLSPPYRITALGDPSQLRGAVEAGETGTYLTEVSSRYGIRVSWERPEELTVPARSVGTLREASPPAPARESAPETPRAPDPDDPAAGGPRKEST